MLEPSPVPLRPTTAVPPGVNERLMPPRRPVASTLRAAADPLSVRVVVATVVDQATVTVARRPVVVTFLDAISTSVRIVVAIRPIKRRGPLRAGAPRVRPLIAPADPRGPRVARTASKTSARDLQTRASVAAPRRASALVAKRRLLAFAAVGPGWAVPILV